MESRDHIFSISLGPVVHNERHTFVHEGTRQYAHILAAEMAGAQTLKEAKDIYCTALRIADEALPQSDGDHHKLKHYALAQLQQWKESTKRNFELAMQDPGIN